MNLLKTDPADIRVGVVGMGLMGTSIIVCLLVSGHKVQAIAPIAPDFVDARKRVTDQLANCEKAGLLHGSVADYLGALDISMNYAILAECSLVIECVIEDADIKRQVYEKITGAVAEDTVIASNTSAIAITLLQKLAAVPERFLGIHFAEPAYATRFMEITCGELTDTRYADWVSGLAHSWGKEPTLLRKDIRGFITNRLMYAVYREVFHLVESGRTNMEDADKAFRYDVGSWITLMGLFRRIDYSGLEDYATIFKTVFPQLSNSEDVPDVMERIVAGNGRGIQNLNGLYSYTGAEAREWETAFAAFNEEIFRLAASYPVSMPEKEQILI